MNRDFELDKGREIEPIIHEISLMKQLIKERAHPLDLLRELVSNSGARQVGAQNIKISYYVHPDYGNVFEVADDGCGMDFTGNIKCPGRLDRFLGLGLSAIVGLEADEFAWKGLGSKLAFQSRRVEVETWTGSGKVWRADINEPWETIERGAKPRPRITQWEPELGRNRGTVVRVFGHPPHRKDKPFTPEEIIDYLYHRSFVGFTRERESPPRIELAVFGQTEEMLFGFPELRNLPQKAPAGTVIVEPIVLTKTLPGTNKSMMVRMRGFYTLDDQQYGLQDRRMNTGLIVSVNGIPYFNLDMKKCGSRQLVVNPGASKCCLVLECDQIHEEMNISRSGLVDSPLTDLFKKAMGGLIEKIENSQGYLDFRRVPEERKQRKSAVELDERKRRLESTDQNWVFWEKTGTERHVHLLREPESEVDTLAILWKLEALGALPFKQFQTLGYGGKGPDLIVHFQEDERSDPERYTTVEVEHRFWSYKPHGHLPAQYPTVICWEIGSTPKLRLEPTEKPYKYVARFGDTLIRVYVIRRMAGIVVSTFKDIESKRTH
ncbi:MAG: hypothetical protein HWN68_12010 [Desulfobacterales bacterium]|nr:hypothetical protein [Desulfobacterales bacterium]